MRGNTTEDALAAWADAVSALAGLQPGTPEHQAVSEALEDLRAVYDVLSGDEELGDATLAGLARRIHNARAELVGGDLSRPRRAG